ncbi:hypothetical protein Cyrtocomes_00659 [Candidatus Cyrtobacter comes]|uniref:Uncharacterized protein n=1 Tax=Candidatus Cyrtobacter comes TaxID=675776 RepID=A0ABU5L8R7_9RICK|nr:hypothetical protein [Candidatus Cyrtobacter comes]MDZ5762280.1 hypothetical protein [Candidatus Cyrtobacter comes]
MKFENLTSTVRTSAGNNDEFDHHILAHTQKTTLPEHMMKIANGNVLLNAKFTALFVMLRIVFSDNSINNANNKDPIHKAREKFRATYKCFSDYMQILQNTTDKTELSKIISDGAIELEKHLGNSDISKVDYEKFEKAFNENILKKMQPAVMKAIETETQKNLDKLGDDLKQYIDQISKIDPKVVGFFKTVIFTPLITPIEKAIDIFRAIINIFKRNPELAQLNDKKIEKLEKVCSALSAFKTKLDNISKGAESKGDETEKTASNSGSVPSPEVPSPEDIKKLQNDFKNLQDNLKGIQQEAPSLIRAVAQTAVFTMGLPIHALVNFGSYMKSGKPLTDAAFTEFKEKVTEAVGQAHGALHENAADETQPNKIQAIVQARSAGKSFADNAVRPTESSGTGQSRQ